MVTQFKYQVAVNQVRNRVMQWAGSAWLSLPSYRKDDIARFVERVAPRVAAGQMQVANLTAAYLRGKLGEFAAVDSGFVTGGRGVAAAEVYRRPAIETYAALSRGEPVSVAIDRGAERLASLVSTDMQMAKVRQAQRSLEAAGVTSYRRVLTGNENCALCVIAATQRYRTSELSPIHPGCDCSVDTLPDDWDPDEQVVDADLLEMTHQAIEARLGDSDRGARDLGLGKTDARGRPVSDYSDLILTREHGEYGPTLTWRDDKFTSKADIPALN